MLKGKKEDTQWTQPVEPEYREPDALDQELALMAQVINVINTNVIRFPLWLQNRLLSNYQECKLISDSLSKEERGRVVHVLATSVLRRSLLWILRSELSITLNAK